MSNANHAAAFLVTGASTGIGRAISLELDRLGHRVFAGVRTEAAAESLRKEASERVPLLGTSSAVCSSTEEHCVCQAVARDNHCRLTPLLIDVTVPETIAAAAKTIGDAVGDAGLAGLVNNAGVAMAGPLEMLPIESFRRQLEVNVIGQLAVTQAMLPLVRKATGRVVFMSSVSGGVSIPYMAAYATSKAAVESIADALRLELRTWGIRVSAIEPGAIATPIWEKSLAAADRLVESGNPTVAELLPLYQKDIDVIHGVVERTAGRASPVERVVRAAVHALTAKRPKAHYYLGGDVFACFAFLRLLPTRWRDWLILKSCGLK